MVPVINLRETSGVGVADPSDLEWGRLSGADIETISRRMTCDLHQDIDLISNPRLVGSNSNPQLTNGDPHKKICFRLFFG